MNPGAPAFATDPGYNRRPLFRMSVPSKLGRVLRKIARPLRWARDRFPLTAKGVLLIAGSALALARYGLEQIDLLLLVVGGVGLAVGALALAVVAPAALVVFFAHRKPEEGEPLVLTTGVPGRSGFARRSVWFVPLLAVEHTWEAPDAEVRTAREGGRLVEWVRPRRRALVTEVVRRFTVRDAWGLAHVSFTRKEPRNVRVVPAIGALRNVPVVRALAGGDDFYDPLGAPQGDRADMRAYGAGDPVRLILWKVYAKSRALMVRTPERARSPSHKTVAYVVAGSGDEPAAGAARAAVHNGSLGPSFRLGADGCDTDVTAADAADELCARSGNVTPDEGGKGLTAFLARAAAESGGRVAARAVLFVPARPGPWVERVVAAAHAHKSTGTAQGGGLEILVCTDGVANEAPRSWWARIFTAPPAIESARAAQRDLNAVTSALSAAHVPVALVDRAAGRVYQNAFRRVAAGGVAGAAASTKEALGEPAKEAASVSAGTEAAAGGAGATGEVARPAEGPKAGDPARDTEAA